MEILGYIASILIGISLGLIGSGGSILTVPVLVYLFSVDTVSATGYSLFIVGITSAIGMVIYYRRGLVNIKTAMVFGIPSIIAVLLTRAYIVPAIPEIVFTVGSFVLVKSMLLMLLFAALMIAASYRMIKKNKKPVPGITETKGFNYPLIFAEGILIGAVTGLVGAGGGFLIIPALVTLLRLPMKEAVGTSLAIITANTLIGFLGETPHTAVNWTLVAGVSCFAAMGIFIGIYLSKKIDGSKLKPAFGWFVLLMGIYIIFKETIFK